MNSYIIEFPLNQEKIMVSFKDPLSLVGWDYAEPILFLRNNDIITIANGPTYFNICDFRDCLEKALSNQFPLIQPIKSDLGLLFNEYYYKSSQATIKQLQEEAPLEIEKYRLWEAYEYEDDKKHVTWIYNDQNGNIILEITPAYPYFYCDKKEEPNYVSYKKWIKNYQPYVIAEILRITALEWLKIAEHIIKTVDDNVNRWEKETLSRK